MSSTYSDSFTLFHPSPYRELTDKAGVVLAATISLIALIIKIYMAPLMNAYLVAAPIMIFLLIRGFK